MIAFLDPPAPIVVAGIFFGLLCVGLLGWLAVQEFDDWRRARTDRQARQDERRTERVLREQASRDGLIVYGFELPEVTSDDCRRRGAA